MMELFQYAFFKNALIGVLIISVAAGIIGTYIITRRMVSISGGVTHACFGGLGLGYYIGWNPVIMAAVFAVVSSLGVEFLTGRDSRVREDSAIAVIWAVGMAIGVLFVFLTPGYVPELNAFLFGNILTITRSDLLAFAIYTIALIAFMATFFKKIVACAFDSDFATVSRLNARFFNCAMTVMVAVCIVLTIRLVGIMLLMSMLTLPQMTAENFCHRFKSLMYTSTVISLLTCLCGLILSTAMDVPCSALIVMVQAAVYAAGTGISRIISGQ